MPVRGHLHGDKELHPSILCAAAAAILDREKDCDRTVPATRHPFGCIHWQIWEGRALQGDLLHPRERVGGAIQLLLAEGHKQPVGYKLDVLRHEARVHANQVDWQTLCDELTLDLHRLCHNLDDRLSAQLVVQQAARTHSVSKEGVLVLAQSKLFRPP